MPFPLGSLPERWRPHPEASPAYASNTRGRKPHGHWVPVVTHKALVGPAVYREPHLRPTARPMTQPKVVAKTGPYVSVRMRCLSDDLSSDTLSTPCTHSRHPPHRRSSRPYVQPAIGDNHGVDPLLRTPRHPSEANLGGETDPLASGLGRRHAIHCSTVGCL